MTITVQGLALTIITASDKYTLMDGWMDGCFVYRRSTLEGHIASNNFYII